MKYRSLGKSGLQASEIGFGAWAIGGGWGPQDEIASRQALQQAIRLGINFIDTAAMYGDGRSERIIGEINQKADPKAFVVTKIPPTAGPWPISPYCVQEERYPEAYLRRSLEQRLRNLQTERIDLLQLHAWTRAWNKNPKALEVLRKFQREGKVELIGVSTPEHDQNAVVELMRKGMVDSVQTIYNIFEQEPAAELLPTAQETGTAVIVRMAFDEGVLTGKYRRDHVFAEGDFRRSYFSGERLEQAVTRVEKLREESAEWGLSLPQLALKFVLAHPAVSTVIAGIRDKTQAASNAGVSALPDLTAEALKALRKHLWVKGFWYSDSSYWWQGIELEG